MLWNLNGRILIKNQNLKEIGMLMTRHEMIAGRECYCYEHADAECLIIQPVDEYDLKVLDKEVETILASAGKPFTLVAFKVGNWNRELAPWPAQPVFGKEAFGDGAQHTLAFITDRLLPELARNGTDTSHCLLGGYSLAGLFALWAGYQTDLFEGIVAASPSVWFPRWMDYAAERKPFARSIYLSLGDKESRTKNPVMSQVADAIRRQHELLQSQSIATILEWNPGNHFVHTDKRMAKGFSWLITK